FLTACGCEEFWMSLQHEQEVQPIGDQEDDCHAQVEKLLLAHRRLRRKEAAECTRHHQADDGDEHNRAVDLCVPGVVFLIVVTQSAEEEGYSLSQQEIRQYRADERSPHPVEQPG